MISDYWLVISSNNKMATLKLYFRTRVLFHRNDRCLLVLCRI